MEREWDQAPFGDLLTDPVRNGIYKPKEFHGRGAKIVNMGELFGHPRLRSIPMKRVRLSDSEATRFDVRPGDLLFARRSLVAEGAGKCCVVLDVDEPTTFESSIIRARPDPSKAESLFLFYFFNSALGLHALDTIRRQVAVAGITGKDLTRLEVPVPRIDEQRAIAHILGTLDDKIELNRRMSETLETIARALFKSWFVDFDPVRAKAEGRDTGLPKEIAELFPDSFERSELGEIPTAWKVRSLGDLADINGWTLTTGDALPFIDYIEISEVDRGTVGKVVRYSKGTEPSRARRRLRHGDAVLSTVRPDRGAHFLCLNPPDSLVASTGFAVLSARDGRWAFVYSAVTRHEVGEELGRLADGGAYPAVRPGIVESLSVVTPTADLLDAYQRTAAPLFERAEANRLESKTLATVRDALLPKLLSGGLHVARTQMEQVGGC